MFRMKPGLPIVIAVPLLCLLPSQHARANDLGGGTIDIDIWLPDGNGGFRAPSDIDQTQFFNRAHCLCPEEKFAARFTLQNAATTTNSCIVEVWVGPGCPEAINRDTRLATCENPTTFGDHRTLRNPTNFPLSVSQLASPNTHECAPLERSSSVYALIEDDNMNDTNWTYTASTEVSFDTLPPPAPNNPELQRGENAAVLSWSVPTSRQEDVWFYQVLCARADGSVDPADGFGEQDPEYETSNDLCGVSDPTIAVQPSGSTGTSSADAGVSPAAGPDIDAGMADASVDAAISTPDAMVNDAGMTIDTLPPTLAALDPSTVCATAAGTETGVRVNGLENGVPYRIVLLSIDRARNVTAIDMGVVTPQPVTDFWEHYKDCEDGFCGKADGGFCLANVAYGKSHPFNDLLRNFRDGALARFAFGRDFIAWYYAHVAPLAAHVQGSVLLRVLVGLLLLPVVLVAALWLYTGPFGFALLLWLLWRRRRRLDDEHLRRGRPVAPAVLAAAALLCVVLAVPSAARAQKYDPYWDHFEEKDVGVGIGKPKWAVELKLGPYLPQIDSEFTLAAGQKGPFAETFGGDTLLLGIVELQRFFAWPAGELGIGTSIGYTSATGKAFDPQGGMNGRAEGDSTTFNLLPVAVNAVYRFTQLDDKYGIPLVPYGKIGLSYYIWWITAPDGDVAEVPTASCPTAPSNDCNGNLARGASLGFQLSVGLAIRAERIDKNSASSLRNELGVHHAGFFVELMYANVDGFNSDKKLNVGDVTWFAGLNFEF